MYRPGVLAIAAAVFLSPASARQDPDLCGTHPLKLQEERFLHRQALRKRPAARAVTALPPNSATIDQGNIAVLDSGNGILVARNQFDLDLRTLTFTPAASTLAYRYSIGNTSYDAGAAASGIRLPLADDDTAAVPLPFSFPFYGAVYQRLWINSDGNLTFTAGDGDSSGRSLGRMAGGPPRISPLLTDLDPSRAGSSGFVRVLSEAARFVVSWDHIPEYSDFGMGRQQTFQVRLYPDGRIEFAWAGIGIDSAVVGIAPGGLRNGSAVLSFLTDPSATYAGLVAERFSNNVDVDLEAAAQQFYQTHDDAYDYLVFYNNMNISAGSGAVSWEFTVRNQRTGYGDPIVDAGLEYGSPRRLQAILNMGTLSQFPTDPKGHVAARGSTADTPLSILGHETGHLFLAYASIRDPADPSARPMLGNQQAHWIFNFNSDASLLEGNRIRDDGAARPEFTTVGNVEGYSPLDQYLMGFLPPEQVEPNYTYGMFLVTGVPATFDTRLPQTGVSFNGTRRDIRLDEIIAAEGRRTPDSTVSQRHFRFAFVLIVASGTPPGGAQVAQLETYRTGFESYYRQATGNRAFADTALRHSLHLSVFPAAGVIAGRNASAALMVDTPPASPLTVALAAPSGAAGVPQSVTLPAGASTVAFTISGLRPGVEEISATPADNPYDVAYARMQVSATTALRISTSGAPPEPVVARVTDVNNLPYPGVRVQAAPSAGGTVSPATTVTDASGNATFQWNPGGADPRLTVSIEGAPEVTASVVAASATKVQGAAVLNAASLVESAAPGMLAAIYGIHLAGGAPSSSALVSTLLTLDGRPVPLVSADDGLIVFYIPPDVPVGTSKLVITNPLGSSAPVAVPIAPVAPGLFHDYFSGLGQGLEQPVHAGDAIPIFATGLGLQPETAQVTIAGVPAQVTGVSPTDVQGIYRVDAVVPADMPAGVQPLILSVGGVESNSVKVGVQ
jgi:uncharacterized protein (TIGR03437 family)